jgi:hypothetical protein
MAVADLASIAAATAAGYKLVQTDRGIAGLADRYYVTLEKPITGDPDGGSGGLFAATAYGATSTTAKTNALAALNNNRKMRYGADTGTVSTGKRQSSSHTRDAT